MKRARVIATDMRSFCDMKIIFITYSNVRGNLNSVWVPFYAMLVLCCFAVANLRLFTMKSYFIREEVNFNG